MKKMNNYFSTVKTEQTSPDLLAVVPQVKNNAGGFVWEVDDWKKLQRFLVLGTEGGSYYVNEEKMTKLHCETAVKLIKQDGLAVVKMVVGISEAGRAANNDYALFILAMCAKLGDEPTRAAAYQALPLVARIGTHLFHFTEYVKSFGGIGGSGFKKAIGRWYTKKPAGKVAYQAVKYQQRDGWSHRDLLRLAHPIAPTEEHQALFHYIVKGREKDLPEIADVPEALQIVWAMEKAKETTSEAEMIKLIIDHNLPHECVPNDFKNLPAVWDALLQKMPITATIRNLNKMTAVGLLDNTSEAGKLVVSRITDAEVLKAGRVHPMTVLFAMKTYQSGHGLKGKLTWNPVRKIVDALDLSFYKAFGAVEPTGKKICLALDVSGSMSVNIANCPGLSAREASAAMALVTANVEEDYEIVAYTCRNRATGWSYDNNAVKPVDISPNQRLDDVIRLTNQLPFGGTDCALPMLWALENKKEFDAFISYTDSETWAGKIHPHQALKSYRNKIGKPRARLIAVGMVANQYSIADPSDAYQMDVVGFDTATPNIISDFVRND